MKFIIISSLVALVAAAPIAQLGASKNLRDMTSAAASFPASFLSGDMTKAAKDLVDMMVNAATYPGAFMQDMAKNSKGNKAAVPTAGHVLN
jgi:hypothetical protein